MVAGEERGMEGEGEGVGKGVGDGAGMYLLQPFPPLINPYLSVFPYLSM